MDDKFVDLGREFVSYSEEDSNNSESLEIARLLGNKSPAVTWHALLTKRRVVILGEPGSGKSREFDEQATVLQRKGEFSLYISLSDVVEKELTEYLPPEYREALERWKSTDRVGYLFLDSVDESRLRDSNDFRRALQSTRRAFEPEHMSRLRIFISSSEEVGSGLVLIDGDEGIDIWKTRIGDISL